MTRHQTTEEAASAVQRALLQCVGPGAAEQLALAQVRLAWVETATAEGLHHPGMWSRLTAYGNGVATITASDPLLAAELNLRAEHLAGEVNRRQDGRPGALYRIRSLAVLVRPGLSERDP